MASSNATLRLFDFPLEIVEKIFDFSIRARTLKRAMRLRLVSKEFCHQANEAIFRSRILEKLDRFATDFDWTAFWFLGKNRKHGRDTAMCSFLQTLYGNPRNFPEDDPASTGFQIRRVAQRICELTGESDRVVLESYMRRLCYGCLYFYLIFGPKEIISGVPDREKGKKRMDEQFDGIVLDAAAYLNLFLVVKQLLANNQLRNSGRGVESRLRIAAYFGHYDIFHYLFSTWDTADDYTLLKGDLIATYLRMAALGGSSRVFNYLLGLFTTTSVKNGARLMVWDRVRAKFQTAMWNAVNPEDYQGGIEKLTSTFNLDPLEFQGDFHVRIICAIRNRRPEMLRCSLDQLSSVSSVALMTDLSKAPRFGFEEVSSKKAPNLLKHALHHSLLKASSKSEAAVKLLLDHGADPNWFSAADTPLMRAVNAGSYGIVRTLVGHGAHLDFGTPPPIALAVKQEEMAIFRYLRLKGATLDTPETGGWAMAFARSYGLDSMMDVLVSEGLESSAVLHRARLPRECTVDKKTRSSATGGYLYGFSRYGFGLFDYNPRSKHLGPPYPSPLECWSEARNPIPAAEASNDSADSDSDDSGDSQDSEDSNSSGDSEEE